MGKHQCWSLFWQIAGLKACHFIKKSCFPVKFASFLRSSILKNISERLLLSVGKAKAKLQLNEWFRNFLDKNLVECHLANRF